MKKTYVKLTTLICALIVIVMLLGCTLFSHILINNINTRYMDNIHNAMKASPGDYELTDEGVENIVEKYSANKFFQSTNSLNIGYYGKTDWKWNNADYTHTIESLEFHRSSAVFYSSEDNVLSVRFIIGDDSMGNAIYHFNSDTGECIRIFTAPGSITSEYTVEVGGANGGNATDVEIRVQDEKNENVNENSPIKKLDKEAQKKYEELFSSNDYPENLDESKIGWFTSYVVHNSMSSLNKGQVQVHEHDVFLFHPFAIVFHNYGHVYLMFLLVLIVLLFLAIFSMHRMYKNRLQFEARTKSLTRSFAHELKTPLAVTKAYVENWDLVEEKERPEVATKINSEVDHMTRMVNTLLDLSKMDSGEVSLSLEEVELFDLSKACYKHLEKIANEKDITFDFTKDKEDGEYKVEADLDMIKMVISNFMSNAIKYGKKNVGVSLSGDGNNVTFKITNDGEPIKAKDKKKIWDLFYKKDKSGTDRLNSNGVGLAVNKSILELHKAKFGVTGSDKGTTFWFEMKRIKE